MGQIKSFSSYFLNESKIGEFYNDELNPKFWDSYKTKDGKKEWVFDSLVRKKLIRISKDFFEKFEELIGNVEISDIQLTGSLSNFNYTENSDLDVHVLVDFSKIKVPKEALKVAIDGIRFIWNLRHDVVIRGHDVELYLQDVSEPHTSSGLYSLKNGKWIRKPKFDPPSIDEQDVIKKFEGIVAEINKMESDLVLASRLPENAKDLYKRLNNLKTKIQKMRKDGLQKSGEFSVGNLVFKKLRNSGYIEKLISLISKSYSRIYSE